MVENLLIGIDLGKHYSQISVYDERKKQIVTISPFPERDNGLIPTVLGVAEDRNTWFYGNECIERADAIVTDMLEGIERGEDFLLYETKISKEVVIEKFLKKLFLLVKTDYPSSNIEKVVITVHTKNAHVEHTISTALENLGIGKNRFLLQSYEESYITYALGQKKELWFQDVALFDFNENKQISIDRTTEPMAIYVIKKDYSQFLSAQKLKEESRSRLAYAFLNIAREALNKQSISTVYITGEGFLNSFAKEVLPELCIGRRVFAGSNLYTRGACYKAMMLAERKKEENYVFMGEGSIFCNIFLPVYKDGKDEYVILSKFGTVWKEAGNWAEVILDDETELQIIINDPLKKEDKILIISLDGIPNRPNRMTRLSIQIEFLDVDEFIITVKDLGFGNFYKTSNRIWEKQVNLR